MTNDIHQFDEALKFKLKDGRLFGHTTAAYANTIGPFGGITAAVMLKAILDHPEVEGEPISLTVNFASAVEDGEFELEAVPQRTNRSTQHWFVRQLQGDEVKTTATAVFGTRRETWQETDLPFPQLPAEAKPFSTDVMPPWGQSYKFRMVGELKDMFFTEREDGETLQSIQDQPPRPLDFASLTAMADAFAPRILIRRRKIVPVGTVAMTVYFHVDGAALKAHGDGEVIGHARANRYFNRYFDQSAELWSPDGELLVTTTQVVYFKE